jgi:hypothetical protein
VAQAEGVRGKPGKAAGRVKRDGGVTFAAVEYQGFDGTGLDMADEPMAAGDTGGEADPVEWARRALGFAADEKQAVVLRSEKKRVILNCSRQWGKSTVTAVKATHFAAHHAGSTTIVLSASARQSREFVRKAAEFARLAGLRTKGGGGPDHGLVLPNRSRIVGLPSKEETIRGFSAVGLLLIDEASRVSDSLYTAVRPMLAVSNGSLWLMSTPNGKTGFFYDVWARSEEDWERVEAPATECPRISRAFLAAEEVAMLGPVFRREYLCCFEDAETAVFGADEVRQAFSGEFGRLGI